MDAAQNPSTPSLAYEALADNWAMVSTILAGPIKVKAAGEKYLFKTPAEQRDEYARRKRSAPWRPEFEEILRAIVGKPFSKPVVVVDFPTKWVEDLSYDIDGRGNNLHTFAKGVFTGGVALGLHGILVDFPAMSPNATMAQEKAAGARPYWVSVGADEILSLRTERVGAREVVVHLRLKEVSVEQDGFAEKTVERIRVIEPKRWQTWRKKETRIVSGDDEWVLEDEGVLSLGEVPFVPFVSAERVGAQYVVPPLLSIAEMQMELYRFMSLEEQIYTMAGAPMLSANGLAAPEDDSAVEVGPSRVLYAPPSGDGAQPSWAYLQPNADNLRAISERTGQIIEDMRRLGLQPLLPRTGQVTATHSSVEAGKAHSTVQAWALDLKDALEQAWGFTAKWYNEPSTEVDVYVNTDFSIGVYGSDEVRALNEARDKGWISEETYWDEMRRRDVLGPAFDKDEEKERLRSEALEAVDEDTLNAATTDGSTSDD